MDGEVLALYDRSVIPDDNVIAAHLGDRIILWKKMLEEMSSGHKNITWSWNYYNDGHQWLFKLVQKKKTIFWGAILATGEFRITFYFADKAEKIIMDSSLPDNVREAFKTAKHYGQIRPATLLVNTLEDVNSVLKLADIKVSLK
ncbi:MAG TPA: DUF3788 family protein [Bacteroidales bacterium]|nr:DUF3788 family protein [Bacteroidales bacterium]